MDIIFEVKIKKQNEQVVKINCFSEEAEEKITEVLFADKKSKKLAKLNDDNEAMESQFTYVITNRENETHTFLITNFIKQSVKPASL